MSTCECNSASQSCGCGERLPAPGPGLALAIATIPIQKWEVPYEPVRALKQGTIFPCLDLPFFISGGGINV